MPKTHRPKEKSFSCNGSNMMMPERSIATGNVVFVFFPYMNKNNFSSVTRRLNIMYVFKIQWFLLLDSNGQKKKKKNVAMFNLRSVSVWCHLNVLPPPAAAWMRYLVLSVGTPAAPLTEPSGFAKVGVLVCRGVCWTSTLHNRLFSSAEVTVSKALTYSRGRVTTLAGAQGIAQMLWISLQFRQRHSIFKINK